MSQQFNPNCCFFANKLRCSFHIEVCTLNKCCCGEPYCFLFSRRILTNVYSRLAPAGLVLFALSLINLLALNPAYDSSFRFIWLVFATPSLVSGAAFAMWMMSRRTP